MILVILWPVYLQGSWPCGLTAFNVCWQAAQTVTSLCHEGGFCYWVFAWLDKLAWSWSWTSWIILFSSCCWNSCEGSSQLADSKLVYCVNSWGGYSWAWSAYRTQAFLSVFWKYSCLKFGSRFRKPILFSTYNMWNQRRMCLEFRLQCLI